VSASLKELIMAQRKRFFGKYRATVADNNDPVQRARLLVTVPTVLGAVSAWAEAAVAMPLAGLSVPNVGDTVWVEFEEGEAHAPLWTGFAVPAGQSVPVPAPFVWQFSTPAGQQVTVEPNAVVLEDSQGNRVRMGAAGVEVQAAAKVRVNALQIELAAGLVVVDAGMSTFSGVVKCDTLIANSVISASYTPGAGNIW
jgi:Type VI secretion system/phage-baseplate injector OB domain